MNKISVGETILRGYGFAARRLLANLGLTWLAAIFYAVAVGYWLQQFCAAMLVSPHPGGGWNDFALFDLFGLVAVTALGSAVIARTLTGEALETGGEIMTAYFVIGRREWILFLSLLRLYLLVIGAVVAVLFAGDALIAAVLPMMGANAQWQGITALSAMKVAAAVVGFAVAATLAVRLGFFAAPVASAERSASLTRNWWLTRGNGWRLFVVSAGLTLPVLLLWAAADWALIGAPLGDAGVRAFSASHDSTALYRVVSNNDAAIAVAWTILIVVLNMLFAGASASAYGVVRNNAEVRRTRTAPTIPVLEPSFAGSAPHHAKEPQAGDTDGMESHQDKQQTFAAAPAVESGAAEIAEPTQAEAELPEQPLAHAHVAEASAMNEAVAEPETPVPQMEAATAEVSAEPHAPGANDAPVPETVSVPMPDDANAAVHEDAPQMAEAVTPAQFPLAAEDADTTPAEPVTEAASEITPLPSHGDATESSQQNAPSEAA